MTAPAEKPHHLAAWLGDRPAAGPPLIIVEGILARTTAASLEGLVTHLLHRTPGPAHLDLTDLDIEDTEGMLALVDLIRARQQAGVALTLIGAPQALGHNLYRARLVEGPNPVRLVDIRQDEPFFG